MDDFIKSIKAHLYDRVTSPLIGTFTVSWVLWNYKFVITLLSSLDVHEKFDYISTFIFSNTYSCLTTGILYPLLTTFIFIFLYPYPAKFVYSFTRERQKELKEIKQKIEDETPLTIEESIKLRRDMTGLKLEYENELERINSENERLKGIIEELKKEEDISTSVESEENIDDVDNSNNLFSTQVDDEQLKLLELISRNEKPRGNDLVSWSKTDKITTEFNLGELLNKGLIARHRVAGGNAYSLSHEGRRLLINEKEVE